MDLSTASIMNKVTCIYNQKWFVRNWNNRRPTIKLLWCQTPVKWYCNTNEDKGHLLSLKKHT